MGSFSIVYEGPSGRQVEELTDDTTLNLYMRAATRVNLESLRDNRELSYVELSKNHLESINLGPLRRCSSLKSLRLRGNRLREIDLWPLVELMSLEEIDLVSNRLQRVNLTPLIGKTQILLNEGVQVAVDYVLRYLMGGKDSSSIKLHKSSGEILNSSPRIHWQYYADLADEYGWESVHYNTLCIIEKLEPRYWFRAQKGLLEGMGISELSGFDGDPSLLLKDLDALTDFHSVRSGIYDMTIELLENQLDANGPTLFLNIEKMAGTRASKLIPKISKLRDKEVEEVVVQIGGNRANLLPLWLTHYGYEILSVLKFGLTADLDGLELIKMNFNKLGYEINTEQVVSNNPQISDTISEGLIDYIYSVATMSYTDSVIHR